MINIILSLIMLTTSVTSSQLFISKQYTNNQVNNEHTITVSRVLGLSDVYAGNSDPTLINIDNMYFRVDNSGKVSDDDGIITEFIDNVYVAHNNLAGRYFDNNVKIRYSNGVVAEYEEVETIVLQALDPFSGSSNYTDGIHLYTSLDIHQQIFSRGVVFMTCYEKDGNPSWGRKFIIMKSVKN